MKITHCLPSMRHSAVGRRSYKVHPCARMGKLHGQPHRAKQSKIDLRGGSLTTRLYMFLVIGDLPAAMMQSSYLSLLDFLFQKVFVESIVLLAQN